MNMHGRDHGSNAMRQGPTAGKAAWAPEPSPPTAPRRWNRSIPRLRDESGQGVVEFAMILPLLAALVFALINCGKVVFFWNNMTQVANEGARLAAVNAGATDSSFNFDALLRGNLQTAELRDSGTTIAVSGSPDLLAGSGVTIRICRTYHVPLYGDLTITGKATMRLEHELTSASILAEPKACP
jgi:hypothetical protein